MLSFPFYISNINLNNDLQPDEVKIPYKIASLWKINTRLSSTLTYHLITIEIVVTVDNNLQQNVIDIHPHLYEQLSLPNTNHIQCTYDTIDNSFQLGPSIGAVIGDVHNNLENPFGPLTPYFEEMAKVANTLHCIFIIFSYKEVRGTYVDGYCYHDQEWLKGQFSLPHVVYNRIGGRNQERSAKAKLFFQQLMEMNIPYFNDRFLNKWETHSIFSTEPTLTPYLPETRYLRSKQDLYNMLDDYNNIYLKPSWGKEGSGIIRIIKDKVSEGYLVTYPYEKGWQTETVKDKIKLFNTLKEQIKKRNYLMQRQIKIKEIYNSPVDFRILCIKNPLGQWESSSAVARIGKENTIVSNLSRGGIQKKVRSVLDDWMPQEDAIHHERFLHELAQHSAEVLDTETDGLYGELGFDFMIDQDNHVWILEVNIKPSKGESIQLTRNTFPSIKLLLTYAASLAEFQH